MRRFIAVIIATVLASTAISLAQESIPVDVLQQVKKASVFVKVSIGPLDYSGSGFVVRADAESVILVTNAHVVAKPNLQLRGLPLGLNPRDAAELRRIQAAIEKLEPTVNVVFNSGTTDEQVVPTKTIAFDDERDLAILKATGVRQAPVPIPLDLDYRPTETTPVFTFGFPFGEALSKSKGNPAITVGRASVSSVRLDEHGSDTVVQIDGALNPGNSGGPVVDVKGRLVGVAVATIRGSGIGFAIPPATLHRMLDGGVSKAEFISRKSKDDHELEIDVKLSLLDPFQKIKKCRVICVTAEATTPVPEASKALEGTNLDLKVENGTAVGTWRFAMPQTLPTAVLMQPFVTDEAGNERRLPSSRQSVKVFVEVPATSSSGPRRRGPYSLMRPVLEDSDRKWILDQLKLQDAALVTRALQTLSQFDPQVKEPEIEAALESLLSHTDDSVRALAAKLIGDWGSKEKAPVVLKLLDDPVASVRHAAMESLATWQYIDAAEPLTKRLNDTTDRPAAKRSLIRMGAGAEKAAVKSLSADELAVRIVTCEILGEIGSKEVALPALKAIADRDTGLIAARAKDAIDRINSRAAGTSPLTLAGTSLTSRKVHVGLPIKQAGMLLTEGAVVLSERSPAVGLGIVQTGEDTMEFTYITLTRLPQANIQSATFSTRKKNQPNRIRSTHTIFLGDDELTIEHLYAPEKLPFVDEEFVLHNRTLSAQNGRVILVDLKSSKPVVVQKNIPLPSAGALVTITDEVVLNLADQAINELIKSDEQIRAFMNGAKLTE